MHYMHQLKIDKQALELNEWANLLKDGELSHKLIWRAFGDVPDRDRDFIFRMDAQPDSLTFLAVSVREPDSWGGRFEVQSKPYSGQVRVGQRLRFRIRTSPSISVKSRPGAKRGTRHDIVSHAKKVAQETGSDRFKDMSQAQIVQEVGQAWLKEKLAREGFDVQDVLVQSYAQANFGKKSKKDTRRHDVRFGSMDFSGIFEVTDVDKARNALLEGIGRKRAYGHGLILVSPT